MEMITVDFLSLAAGVFLLHLAVLFVCLAAIACLWANSFLEPLARGCDAREAAKRVCAACGVILLLLFVTSLCAAGGVILVC